MTAILVIPSLAYLSSWRANLSYAVNWLISSKLFIKHLSRRIIIRERRKKSSYRKKPSSDWHEKDQWENVICVQSLSCTRIFFVSIAGLEVLIKVTSKANRWKESRKSFTKKLISNYIFSIIKNVFHHMLAKFSCLIWTH